VAGQPHPARKGADAPGPHESPSSINRQGELKANLGKATTSVLCKSPKNLPSNNTQERLVVRSPSQGKQRGQSLQSVATCAMQNRFIKTPKQGTYRSGHEPTGAENRREISPLIHEITRNADTSCRISQNPFLIGKSRKQRLNAGSFLVAIKDEI
jgi:hypothetical protein